jgi:signal transduction histidine kinase
MTPVGLHVALRARLLPLAVLVGVVVWLTAPLSWTLLRLGELKTAGRDAASIVVELVRRELTTRPQLWRYDAAKLKAQLAPVLQRPEVRAVAVVDRAGRRLDLGDAARSQVVWTCVQLSPGELWVAVDAQPIVQGAVGLWAAFGGLALALATGLVWLPLRAIRRAEQRIDDLANAQDARIRAATHQLRELAARAAGVQEDERRRIARDLHDGLGQTLTALRLQLQVGAPAPMALQLCDDAIDETRQAVHRLAPPALAELGLAAALRRHCHAVAERTGLDIDCRVDEVRASPAVELAAWRVAQEALTNVVRHAAARRVSVQLCSAGDGLLLQVRDDGRGIGTSEPGVGRRGMRERAELLGGALTWAGPPGTTVILRLPLDRSPPT